MTFNKVLSIFTFIGIIFMYLIGFGFTWKALGMGIVISAVLSIIYYIVLKKAFEPKEK